MALLVKTVAESKFPGTNQHWHQNIADRWLATSITTRTHGSVPHTSTPNGSIVSRFPIDSSVRQSLRSLSPDLQRRPKAKPVLLDRLVVGCMPESPTYFCRRRPTVDSNVGVDEELSELICNCPRCDMAR